MQTTDAVRWFVNGIELAQLLGVDPGTVTRWTDDGMPCQERGAGSRPSRYDLRSALPWAVQRIRTDSDPGAAARAALAQARAEREQLRLAVDAGQLVLAVSVKKAATAAARQTRDTILAVPDRIAALVAAETDAARVHAILHHELSGCLRGLAQAMTTQEPTDGH